MFTQCPSCRSRARLPDEHLGTRVRCAECGTLFVADRVGAPDEERRSRRRRVAVLASGLALTVLAGLVCAPARLPVAVADERTPPPDAPCARSSPATPTIAATHEEMLPAAR